MAGTSLGALFVELFVKDADFGKKLDKAEGKIKKFGSAVDQLTSGIAGKFQSAMLAATAAVAGLAAASSVVGAQFEQQITKVAVLAGASVDELAEAARRMGSTTQFSAVQAAGAMESLAQAGLSTDAIIQGTEAALALAAASGGELADATKIVAATMSQFSLDADNAGRISDVYTEALNASQLSMESLTSAMSFAGTVGAGFGHTLEETTAAVAMFSNLGLEGSKAGTAFRMAMSQAANVSVQAEKTLTKLGLSAKSINPELNSFGEILEVVGKSGMTASQAMQVFGTEVGGNVIALAQQAVDSGTDFNTTFAGITKSLTESSGLAADTAQSMTQTVMGAFEVARSAFDEILLTLFDLYGAPLQALLRQVAEFFGEVARQFNFASGALSGGLGEGLEDLTKWLDDNETKFAAMIVIWAQRLVEVGRVLAKIIPHLDKILVLMGAVWAVNAVVAFASTLGGVFNAVVLLQGALAALAVEVSVMTLGIYAAVAAFVAIMATIASYVVLTGEAERAAERLTSAQAKQKILSDKAFDGEVASMEARLDAMKRAAIDEIETREGLNKSRRQELDRILELDAAGAVLLVRQGKLVDVAGELRTASSLLDEQMDTANAEKMSAATQDLAVKYKSLSDRQKALGAEMAKVNDGIKKGVVGAKLFTSTIGQTVGEEGVNSLEEAQARFNALGAEMKQVREAATQLKGDVVLAKRAMSDAALEEQRNNDRLRRSTADFSVAERNEIEETAKKQASERERMREATERLYQDTADAAALAAATETEQAKVKLDQQLRDITSAFAEELALYEDQASDVAAIEARRDATIGAARDAFHAADLARRAKATEALGLVMRDAEDRLSAELLASRADTMSQSVALATEMNSRMRALDEQLADALLAITDLSAEERAEAEVKLAESAADDRTQIQAEFSRKMKVASDADLETAKAAPSGFVQAWSDAMDAVADRIPAGMQVAFARTKRDIQAFLGEIQGAANGVASVIDGVGSGLFGMVEQISGFSLNLSDITGGVQAAQDDAARAAMDAALEAGRAEAEKRGLTEDEAIAKGIIPTQEELDAIGEQAGMALDTGGAASQFVNDLLAEADTLIALVVSAVPPALEAVAAGLPALFDAVVAAIPILVDAIAESAPKIIQAVVDVLPSLFNALVNGAITLLGTLFDILPDLLTQLLSETLPEMIGKLASAIPKVIQMFVAALPDILDAIVTSLPILIEAVIMAIPPIITAVVDAIPDIILIVIRALPDLVEGLVRTLPVLLGALLAMIPSLIAEIISDLPEIFEEMITLVPDVAMAFIVGLVDGVKAFADAFIESISGKLGGFFDKDGDNIFEETGNAVSSGAESIWDGVKGLFSGGKGAYSGVEYVPATMRMTVHKGERIVPADRNATGSSGPSGPGAAGFGQNFPGSGGGGSSPVELAVLVDGQVVDGALISAVGQGRAPKLQRMIRSTSGVTVGFDRGRYTPWSK